MIVFGMGKKVRDVALDATHHLRVVRSFFHIFFILTATGDRTFVLAELGPTGWGYRAISEPDAALLCGGVAPDINQWWRFSLFGAIGLGVVAALLGAVFSQ